MSTNPQIPLFRGVIENLADGRPPIVDERPEVLVSKTYRLMVPLHTETLSIYLTVSDRDGRPFEFFLNCTNVELSEYLAAVSLLGSRMLRNGFAVEMVAEDLIDIASPHTGHMRKGGYCPSLSALIGQTLLQHADASEHARAETHARKAGTDARESTKAEARSGSKPGAGSADGE